MTESDPVKLAGLDSLDRESLRESGFVIQSCNTNCDNLRSEMSRDDTLSTHDDERERVPRYIYNPLSETLHVAPVRCNLGAWTKRQILFEVAKVFDPLSLCLPVTVRSRFLFGMLWKKGLGLDVQLL